jgi:hypothetical protein
VKSLAALSTAENPFSKSLRPLVNINLRAPHLAVRAPPIERGLILYGVADFFFLMSLGRRGKTEFIARQHLYKRSN